MAAQFGNHPTLTEYIAWACGQGCTTNSGVSGTTSLLKITSPDGSRWVHVVGVLHGEHLAPGMVGQLDRRLGLKSPFSSI